MRAPRTTIPCSVSPVLCSGTGLSTRLASVARSIVGWTIVWVSEMSSSASWRWKATRLAWPSTLVRSGPFPPRPFPGEAGERHVHVVGRAAHQPHRRLGDAGQPFVAALQIGLRPRDHVADVDLLTGLRVVHQALRLALELPIEDRRHRLGGLGERRMVGDVADPFVADPDVRPARGQRLQELVSGPRPHGQPSLRIARCGRDRRRSSTIVDRSCSTVRSIRCRS